jgi:hypothetical protein
MPTTWCESVADTIDVLQGGAVTRLRELASNPPTGPGAIASWHKIETRLGLAQAVDPVQAGGNYFPVERRQENDALKELVRALADAVDRALDAGVNDAADPIFRLRDLTVVTIGGGPYSSWRAARVDPTTSWTGPGTPGVPESLRDIPPYVLSDGTRVLLLARSSMRFIRASAIRRVTTPAADQQRYEQQEAERVRQREEARRLELAADLERRAAQLRGAQGLCERAGP